MRTIRLKAAKTVAERLFAAERAIDLAYASIAELNAALPTARLDANLSAAVGQDAVRTSAKAMAMAARMRQQIVATHAHLAVAGGSIGLREVSFGDELKVPSSNASASPAAHLRTVA